MSLEAYQQGTGVHRMQLKTIFNRLTEYKPFVAEATGGFERKANNEATRFATVQPEECTQPPDERGLSAILGLYLSGLGGQVP